MRALLLRAISIDRSIEVSSTAVAVTSDRFIDIYLFEIEVNEEEMNKNFHNVVNRHKKIANRLLLHIIPRVFSHSLNVELNHSTIDMVASHVNVR